MWRKGDPESASRAKGAEHGLKYPCKGVDREQALDPEDRRDCPAGKDERVWEDPSGRRLRKEPLKYVQSRFQESSASWPSFLSLSCSSPCIT